MSDDISLEQIDAELEALDERSEKNFVDCDLRTAMRTAKEATRTAKSHGLVLHYMRGLFDQMRFGHGLLDARTTREAAVELVMLLEDEEQARRIQPDFPEDHYYWMTSWMSSCAYDNLAEATATLSGYNSSGMHDCINDGLQVCRQTGKLECIKCFRDYASDVYLASDDFAMVRHQCQALIEYRGDDQDNKDRRWSGRQKLAWLHLLEGHPQKSIDELQLGLSVADAESVYIPRRAKLTLAVSMDESLILAGQPRFDWTEFEKEFRSQGEWLYFEFKQAELNALATLADGHIDDAIQQLTELDRQMTEVEGTKHWFEIRLRLIAAYLLNDNRSRAEALAKGLEAKATESQDYLTLHRLSHLMSTAHVSPVPTLNDLDVGPFAGTASTDSVTTSSADDGTSHGANPNDSNTIDTKPNDSNTEEEDEVTPLGEVVAELMQNIMSPEQDDESRVAVLDQLVGYSPASIEHHKDAAYMVHLTRFVVQGSDDARRVWDWASGIRAHFVDSGIVQSVVAALGHYFQSADPTEFADIKTEDLEKWFRSSLQLDMNHARNYARAGDFFMAQGEAGEAERCFARAFRLDRTDGSAAQQLADLYRETERPRDAMAVLDLCLREGTDDPNVAWEAGMVAMQLEQYDSMLTYIERFLESGENLTWANYYRGVALLELGRFEEAIAAFDTERQEEIPGDIHLTAYHATALIELKRDDEAREQLQTLIGTPLRTIDYLSGNGLLRIFGRVWTALTSWPADDETRTQFESKLLSCGLMPDDYFQPSRSETEIADVHFYRVRLKQTLPADWSESDACMPGEEEWKEYTVEWGVLEKSEEAAVSLAQDWQRRCCGEAVLESVDRTEEVYQDAPGIVWQGMRWSDDENEDDNMNIDI